MGTTSESCSVSRTALHAAVLGGHTECMGHLIGGGASAFPEHVLLSLVRGNIRGARRLAMANGYSWALWRSVVFNIVFVLVVLYCVFSSWATARPPPRGVCNSDPARAMYFSRNLCF